MAHPVDYKVKERGEIQLAADAEKFRKWLRVDHLLEFDPLHAIEHLKITPYSEKGILSVVPFRAVRGSPPARVKYNPLKLFVADEVLAAAKDTEPYARFILDHEIGHIIEHDHSAKAFSDEEAARLTAWPKELRAEWQADTFAYHVSLPWRFIVAFYFDRLELASRCNVLPDIVDKQIASLRRARNYSLDPCPQCSNFTVVRRIENFRCDNCSWHN